jgi:hypothetical protein
MTSLMPFCVSLQTNRTAVYKKTAGERKSHTLTPDMYATRLAAAGRNGTSRQDFIVTA